MDFEANYDVLIAGAGVAGVAAAVEAARGGLRVGLVEKTILLGGLATTGLVDVYLPLCDGRGTQVLFGLAEEMLYRAIRYGPGRVPAGWPGERIAPPAPKQQRYYIHRFSPAALALALDEMLDQAGEAVDLWLDTLICQPVVSEGRIAGLEVENKSGRGLLRAECVIDATGDADVAHRAGCPTVLGNNWPTIWITQASLDAAQAAVAEGRGTKLYDTVRLGGAGETSPPPGEGAWHGVDAREITEFVRVSRRLLREHYRSRLDEIGPNERENTFPLGLPAMAQYRTTRRIAGRAELTDGQDGVRFEDAIALTGDWRQAGPVWEIPFGSLVPQGAAGLLAAGRCIGSDGDAWHVTRVIPPAVATGQAAGAAAALAREQGVAVGDVNVALLQERLASRGIPLHLEDVGLAT